MGARKLVERVTEKKTCAAIAVMKQDKKSKYTNVIVNSIGVVESTVETVLAKGHLACAININAIEYKNSDTKVLLE